MALVVCPDCGKEISDAAPACPGCGRPLARTAPTEIVRVAGKYEAAGFLIILGGLALSFSTCAGGAIVGLVGLLVFIVGRFK